MSSSTILVADDSPADLALLRFLLSKKAQYEVIEAVSGSQTLEAVRCNPNLDLVLLDVHLPDLSGIEICRRLKEDAVTGQVPIVLISAVRTGDSDIAEGLKAGADGYLTKPIDETALTAWVKAALRLRAFQRVLAEKGVVLPQGEREMLQTFSRLSHAVNNPLQTIMAGIDLLAIELEKRPEADVTFQDINTACERIAELVANASRVARDRLNALESR